jgi:hypothetical protein
MHFTARKISQGPSHHQFVGSSSGLLSWSCLLGLRSLDDFNELVSAERPKCARCCAARTQKPNGGHLTYTNEDTNTLPTSVGGNHTLTETSKIRP